MVGGSVSGVQNSVTVGHLTPRKVTTPHPHPPIRCPPPHPHPTPDIVHIDYDSMDSVPWAALPQPVTAYTYVRPSVHPHVCRRTYVCTCARSRAPARGCLDKMPSDTGHTASCSSSFRCTLHWSGKALAFCVRLRDTETGGAPQVHVPPTRHPPPEVPRRGHRKYPCTNEYKKKLARPAARASWNAWTAGQAVGVEIHRRSVATGRRSVSMVGGRVTGRGRDHSPWLCVCVLDVEAALSCRLSGTGRRVFVEADDALRDVEGPHRRSRGGFHLRG